MPKKTDAEIKAKHKELDNRIKAVLVELRGKPKINTLLRLRQAFKNTLPLITRKGK